MSSSMDIVPTPGTQDAPDTIQSPQDEPSSSSSPKINFDPRIGAQRPALRKRSVTGCLTCRRRRVKCDQGKPACQNCIKAKRECEGYNQRLAFREPMGQLMGSPDMKNIPNALPPKRPLQPLVPRPHQMSSEPVAGPSTNVDATMDKKLELFPLNREEYPVDDPRLPPLLSDTESDDDKTEIPPDGLQLESFLLNGIRGQPGVQLETSLTTYQPSPNDSPLTNPNTAKIFWHFVNVVAPTISLYESCGMYNGRFALVKPTPVTIPYAAPEVSVWIESFPLMSFRHPALLQAILALASLHVANLQGLPPVAAMKHYHLSLRRIARNLQDPSKRRHPAMAACLLLLAYFEAWMADFEKWRGHLSGLCQMFNRRESGDAGAVVVTASETSFTVHRPREGSKQTAGPKAAVSQRGPEEFEQLREIYWTLFRMDVYQSFLAGTPPLLARAGTRSEYPPRAPIGDLTTIHGTSDHLFSLLRRVADFAVDEKHRRTSASETTRPNKAVDGGRGKEEIIAAQREASAASDWSRLRQKFESFKCDLGEDYQPLEDGSSLQFRSYAVAGIWMNFHMGLIHLYRLEPSLPPNIMVAVGPASKDTAPFADHILRTAAWLVADPDLSNTTTVHPVHAAALTESCVPLLTAGLQMRKTDQRYWLIRYLMDVERLTGHQFARYVRDACESYWIRIAALGRGPPYNKYVVDAGPSGESVWQHPRVVGRAAEGEMRMVPRRHEQSHYALGLLALDFNEVDFPAVTNDMKQLGIADTTRGEGKTINRRQHIMDKKAHLEDLKSQRAARMNSIRSNRVDISDALASQIGEPSFTATAGPKGPVQKLTREVGKPSLSSLDPSTNGHPEESSVGIIASDLATDDSSWSMEETDDDSQASTVKSEGVVDPTTRVLGIVQQNKERVVREVAQYCRKIIGNHQAHDPSVEEGCDNGEGQAPKSSSKKAKGIAQPNCGERADQNHSRAKAQRGRDADDRDEDENGKRRPNKKARFSAEDTTAEGLRLACPYFKRNPTGSKIGQSCGGPGWNTIHRLKEHLYRRHICVRCLRCSASFGSEDDLVAHSRAATACTVSCTTIDPDDGFEKQQEALLRRRWKVVSTTEDQWRHVYKILFPDDSEDLMPSPYYQDHRTVTDEFARFELFLRRETSRLLEERLNESLLDGNANLDPASLAGQLSQVVNEIQSEAIRSYRNSTQVETGGVHQPASRQADGSHESSVHVPSVSSPYVTISEILARNPGPNPSRDSSSSIQEPGRAENRSSSEEAVTRNTDELGSWYDLLSSTDFDFGEMGEAGNWTGNGFEFLP